MLCILGGLALVQGLGWILMTYGAPPKVTAYALTAVAVVVIVGPMGWLLINRVRSVRGSQPRWLDADLAPESLLKPEPPRKVRRATSAASLLPVLGPTRVVARADVRAVRLADDGLDRIVRVTLVDRSNGRTALRIGSSSSCWNWGSVPTTRPDRSAES